MTGTSILIVEDERILARDLEKTLQRAGYCVPGVAATGAEAIRSAQEFKPDLILMDIKLRGDIDGIEAAGRIHDHLEIPILFLSSIRDSSLLERAKTTEPLGYLLKPYEEQDLVTTIDVVLHQHRAVQRRSRKELSLSEARFRTLFDSNRWGLALVNRGGRIIEANPSLHKILGYAPGQLNQTAFSELIHPDDRTREARFAHDLFHGTRNRYEMEMRLHGRGGGLIWAHTEACKFSDNDEGDGVDLVLHMMEDVTGQKALRDRLAAAQRLATVGTLAVGLAHNLANDLTPAVLGIPLVQQANQREDFKELLEVMGTSLTHSCTIIRKLLQMSRPCRGRETQVDCREIVGGVAAIVRAVFPRIITLNLAVSPRPLIIVGNPDEIHQCLLNLCMNARDVMPTNGTLTLTAHEVVIQTDREFHADATPGPYVVLTVADTGSGIAPDILDRIFEPFFSTKPAGAGSGLGLATTREMVKAHGGFICVHSQVARGTEFQIYLPASAATLPTVPWSAANETVSGPGLPAPV